MLGQGLYGVSSFLKLFPFGKSVNKQKRPKIKNNIALKSYRYYPQMYNFKSLYIAQIYKY